MNGRVDRADGYTATGVALLILGAMFIANEVMIGWLAIGVGGCVLFIGLVARAVQVGMSLTSERRTFDRDR